MNSRIFYLVLFLYLAISIYLFVEDIVIKNIDQRVSNALHVFNNKDYQVEWQDFPTQYFNKYYQENMDLNAADFYWSSSRKSYLACGESWDFPSYDAIQRVLEKGARVINLDLYSQQNSAIDPKAIPVVRNSTISPLAQPLDFRKCLQVISQHAWKKNPDYPLILYLEINTEDKDKNGQPIYNKYYLQQIAKALLDVLPDRLINKLYGFNGRDNKYTLGAVPISQMLGKVAIITNIYPTVGLLDEITHGVGNSNQQFVKVIPFSDINRNYGGLRSTHQDKEALIQHNYKYLSIVDPVSNTSIFNFLEPKEDLYNVSASDPWSFGCQIVLMNFQLFDDNMREYINKFQKSALVLKPDNLRYIPKPRPPIQKQEVPLYYGPRKLEQKGWFNHTI